MPPSVPTSMCRPSFGLIHMAWPSAWTALRRPLEVLPPSEERSTECENVDVLGIARIDADDA